MSQRTRYAISTPVGFVFGFNEEHQIVVLTTEERRKTFRSEALAVIWAKRHSGAGYAMPLSYDIVPVVSNQEEA